MKLTTFKDVSIGDKVYQHDFYAPNKWREVTDITTHGDNVSLSLGVSGHPTIDTRLQIVGYAREAIAVKRSN